MTWQEQIDADCVRFTSDELKIIGRLAQDLLSNALDVETLADIYRKTIQHT